MSISRTSTFSTVILLSSLAVVGCGGGGSAGDVKDQLRVASSTPSNGEADVALREVLEFIFSEPLDPSTIDATSVSVTTSRGTVSGDVDYVDSTNTVVFTPDQPLALAVSHQVRINTGIAAKTGERLASDYLSTFTTRDGLFTAPELLETENSASAYTSKFVTNDDGAGFQIWVQSLPSGYVIWARRYDPESGWRETTRIAKDIVVWAIPYTPAVGVDAAGNALVAWEMGTDTNGDLAVTTDDWTSVFGRRYDASTNTWQAVFPIDTSPTADAYRPELGIDPRGNAVVVWGQSVGFSAIQDLNVSRYDADANVWSTPSELENETGDTSGYTVEMSLNGSALVLWHQNLPGDVSPYSVRSRYFDNDSKSWGTAQSIQYAVAGHGFLGDVAFDANGLATAVWRQHATGSVSSDAIVHANRFIPGSGWQGPTPLEVEGGEASPRATVLLDDAGNALVVWGQYTNPYSELKSNYFAIGSGWQGVRTVSGDNRSGLGFGILSGLAESTGRFTVAWSQSGDAWANQFDPVDGWAAPELLDTSDAGRAQYVRVAGDPNGNAIAVWSQRDDPTIRDDLWYNRYVNGVGWMGAQLLETDDTGRASSVNVRVDRQGRAVATWIQQEATDRYDVWTRRFR